MAQGIKVAKAASHRLEERARDGETSQVLAPAGYEPLTLCAPAIPGESLISQIGRYHVTSGNVTTRDTYAELFGRAPFQLTLWVPPRIGALGERFSGRPTVTIQRFLRESTLFPLLEMFTGAQFSAREEQDHIDAVLQSLPKRMVGAFGWTRLCPQCLTDDEETYGVSGILSAHQIPGVSTCFRHGIPLLDRCPHCRCPFERKNDLVLVPWEGCSACHRRLTGERVEGATAARADDHVTGFARFAARLLASGARGASREGLVRLYRTGIKELGLMRGSTVDRKELIRQLVDQYGEEFVKHVDPAYRTDRVSGWFHILVQSTTWETHLGRHLLLSHFLYEDADRFLTQYRQVALAQALSPGVRIVRPTSEMAMSTPGDLMQQVVDASKAIPNCDLDALWREHYGLMKRLVRQDHGALHKLQQELVRNVARKSKPARRAGPGPHPDDAAWAEKLRQSVPSFYNGPGYPQQGTRTRLLKRIGWKRNYTLDLPGFPQLRLALEAACESSWHFYTRRILWALTQPSARTLAPSQICNSSGVEWHKARALMDYCLQKGIPRNAGPSSLMTILRDWQIDLSWAGPCPERVFAKAGRDYQRRTRDGD